uniref:Niemann-Pick C1 N-terminal domain-containing protein n=1 Tax=Timema douglasi TaxID=61478 RepID=A0A7R8VAT4_TIMDO|nr:unnamed protein product [Timema douglasi]
MGSVESLVIIFLGRGVPVFVVRSNVECHFVKMTPMGEGRELLRFKADKLACHRLFFCKIVDQPEMGDRWMSNPFKKEYFEPASLSIPEKKLLELASDTTLKNLFNVGMVNLVIFWTRRVHLTEIRISISPSSAVELNTTSALANYSTMAGLQTINRMAITAEGKEIDVQISFGRLLQKITIAYGMGNVTLIHQLVTHRTVCTMDQQNHLTKLVKSFFKSGVRICSHPLVKHKQLSTPTNVYFHPDEPVSTCCDSKQLQNLDTSITMAAGFIQRCPACMRNLARHLCDMTCSPSQSRFINVTEVEKSKEGKEFVNALELYATDTYISGTYNSCKQVSVPSTGQLALDLMCGDWGASRCSPMKWFTFMGDAHNNPYTPFQITYVPTNTPVAEFIPLDPVITPCNESVSYHQVKLSGNNNKGEGIANLPACSCLDCEVSCPVPPPEPAPAAPFIILGIDGVEVIMVILFVVGTILFLLVVFCWPSGKNAIGKFCQLFNTLNIEKRIEGQGLYTYEKTLGLKSSQIKPYPAEESKKAYENKITASLNLMAMFDKVKEAQDNPSDPLRLQLTQSFTQELTEITDTLPAVQVLPKTYPHLEVLTRADDHFYQPDRMSSLKKLQRVTAYVLLFVNRICPKAAPKEEQLTSKELNQTLQVLVQAVTEAL